MSTISLEEYKAAFQAQLDGRARASDTRRASALASLREQLRALIDPALVAAVEAARTKAAEARADVERAAAAYQQLQAAQVERERVPELVARRAQVAGELQEYQRLAEAAQAALTRAEAALDEAGRQAFLRRHAEALAAFEEAKRAGGAEAARLEAEFRKAEQEAMRPAHEAEQQLRTWRLLADELGLPPQSYQTRLERINGGPGHLW